MKREGACFRKLPAHHNFYYFMFIHLKICKMGGVGVGWDLGGGASKTKNNIQQYFLTLKFL